MHLRVSVSLLTYSTVVVIPDLVHGLVETAVLRVSIRLGRWSRTVSVHLESKASGEDGSQHGEVVAEEGAVVVAG